MKNNQHLPKNWILVRGLMRSQFHWKNFPELLRKELQLNSVQTVELPGNGLLCAQETPTSIDAAIGKIRSQISVSGAKSFGLIGISLGGMLATRWAQIFPLEVSHLVLINSSSNISPFNQRLKPANYPGVVRHFLFRNPSASEEFILQTTSNSERLWRPQLSENVEFLKAHPLSTLNFFRQLKLTGQTDFSEVPKAAKLILTSKADRLVSYKCSEKISQLWGCAIRHHETAGHDLPLDDGSWLAENIKDAF